MRWSTKHLHENKKAKKRWHVWFAWFPVKLFGCYEWRWLEKVSRKFDVCGRYVYRDSSYLMIANIAESIHDLRS